MPNFAFAMDELLRRVRACRICEKHLPLGPRPVLSASPESRIMVVGQAPGLKVHQTGIPWNDASGKNLRNWMGVSPELFYDPQIFAIIPMGFCYPGRGKSGDLPPRSECAPTWHPSLFAAFDRPPELVLLIGNYARKYYLGNRAEKTLTETVRNFRNYLPLYFPLPHPSPRNNLWMKKNPWFEEEVLPALKRRVLESI